MKVFIAFGCIDYEGSYVLGVFTTKELAESECNKSKASDDYYDDYSVEEFELDKSE